jgi:hypothetical protein
VVVVQVTAMVLERQEPQTQAVEAVVEVTVLQADQVVQAS